MRHSRLIIIALAAICVMVLVSFALVNSSAQEDPGDVIIIRAGSYTGGSLQILCGKKPWD